jgi:lysozyme
MDDLIVTDKPEQTQVSVQTPAPAPAQTPIPTQVSEPQEQKGNIIHRLLKKLKKVPKFVWIICIAVLAAVLIGVAAFQLWHMFATTEIKGIDVSRYQGNVSWRAVSENESAKFVYIKATEGMTYQDLNFKKNWEGAAKYGITEGAYHYFTMTSSGSDQAENFISMVPKQKGKLPPAIDVETKIANENDFKAQLADYVKDVTNKYGQKPVFYVSSIVYNLLYDDYSSYSFWIINYNGKPADKGWTFWQYSEKGSSPGIDGKIDQDIYRGSLWDFNKLLSK